MDVLAGAYTPTAKFGHDLAIENHLRKCLNRNMLCPVGRPIYKSSDNPYQ